MSREGEPVDRLDRKEDLPVVTCFGNQARDPMLPHQQAFLDTTLARGVLRFGEFTLKSGRQSPYFFNMGRIDSGKALADVGTAYAARSEERRVGKVCRSRLLRRAIRRSVNILRRMF